MIQAAEVCPGECIFIEIDVPVDAARRRASTAASPPRIEIRDDEAAA